MDNLTDLQLWLKNLVDKSNFKIENIKFSNSKSWKFDKNKLHHESNCFFKIIGLQWIYSFNNIEKQPFIDQREVGFLGFLLRKNNEQNELLVQAKIEPGNIGIIQLAPTLQVTDSNSKRIHGGNETPYLQIFNNNKNDFCYSFLQSEQGTRFYNKMNQNVLLESNMEIDILENYQWIQIETILNLLQTDFLFNTDARSVITCSPWENLINRVPFTKYNDKFSKELRISYIENSDLNTVQEIKDYILILRQNEIRSEIISINEIYDWKLDDFCLSDINNQNFMIRQIKVETNYREVFTWDQPILDSYNNGLIILLCGRKNNKLHFLFKTVNEPGLINQVELTPVITNYQDFLIYKEKISKGKKIIDSFQSEEGGRFFQDINHFQIIDIGNIFLSNKNEFWLTLKDIRELLNESSWFTNESRSIISFLLTWL
jgi:oxidase EvaA